MCHWAATVDNFGKQRAEDVKGTARASYPDRARFIWSWCTYIGVSLHIFLIFLIEHSTETKNNNKKNSRFHTEIEKRNHATVVTEGQLDISDLMHYNTTTRANIFPKFKVNQQAQV